MQKSALFTILFGLMVVAGTISASACNNFGRSDCTPRDMNCYSYGYGGYFEDSAIAGYYAPSPGYGPYPPTPVYGYAPPPAYGYYPPVPVYGLYPPAPVYGYAPPPAYGYYPPAPGYYRSYYRAPTYRYRDVGWRRW